MYFWYISLNSILKCLLPRTMFTCNIVTKRDRVRKMTNESTFMIIFETSSDITKVYLKGTSILPSSGFGHLRLSRYLLT